MVIFGRTFIGCACDASTIWQTNSEGASLKRSASSNPKNQARSSHFITF